MGIRKKANGDGSITKRQDGRYSVSLGSVHTTASDEKSAKKKLRELKERAAKGETATIKRMTVENYMFQWLALYKKPNLKPKSYKRLTQTFENQIKPYIGRLQIQSVKSDDIQNMINRIMSEHSYSTMKKAYDFVNECFKQGILKRELLHNPCDGVKIPKRPKKSVDEAVFCYNPEQVREIVSIATSKNSRGRYNFRYGNVILLLLYTGIREGEALYLKWKNVDFENRQIYVCGNVVDVDGELIEQDTPKTNSGNRYVPLTDGAVQALMNLKDIIKDNDRVIATSAHKPVNPSNIHRTMDNILKRCESEGVGTVKNRVHALRHTFATSLIKSGVDIKAVSEVLGHSDVTTTLNIYHHIMQEQKRQSIMILDNYFA